MWQIRKYWEKITYIPTNENVVSLKISEKCMTYFFRLSVQDKLLHFCTDVPYVFLYFTHSTANTSSNSYLFCTLGCNPILRCTSFIAQIILALSDQLLCPSDMASSLRFLSIFSCFRLIFIFFSWTSHFYSKVRKLFCQTMEFGNQDLEAQCERFFFQLFVFHTKKCARSLEIKGNVE